MLKYTKAERISLKEHPDFDERWVHRLIIDDPTILGLGDLGLIATERRQERAGRLDLLLDDGDNTRFVVELMLGDLDPSHMVRCIEYYDIERRRYPKYQHVAVIVAEDITSRFINVLSLFAGSIPLVAMQMHALKVGDQLVLEFVKIIDQRELRDDDEREGSRQVPADRAYWVKRANEPYIALAEKAIELLGSATGRTMKPEYLRNYMGVADEEGVDTSVRLHPRKKKLGLGVVVTDVPGWTTRLEDAGMDAFVRNDRVRVVLRLGDLEKYGEHLRPLFQAAAETR